MTESSGGDPRGDGEQGTVRERGIVEQLCGMGYDQEEASAAVRAVGGDLDLALDYLQSPGKRVEAYKAAWDRVPRQAARYEEPISLGKALSTNWLNPGVCTGPRTKKKPPPAPVSPRPVRPPAAAVVAWRGTTVVKTGETAAGVALRCDVPLSQLRSQNGLARTAEVYPGQTLRVPK